MMTWIVCLVLATFVLASRDSVRRLGLIAPAVAVIAAAGGLSTYFEARPAAGLRPSLEAAQAYSMTEVKADGRGHYITNAEINGSTVKVMVDTGASAVALSYEDAEEVGLRPFALDFDIPVSTANGVVKAARITLRRVEIDNVRVRDVEGWVLPEGAMRGSLLGMSFLSRLSSFRVEDGVLHLED